MLIVYPSNRLEDLIILLDKVLENRQGHIFDKDQILVESQGMQHWINMQLAQQKGIAMNIDFPMPSRFIWDLARQILGDELIPKKSPYSREILAFRIEQIISESSFNQDPDVKAVLDYWQKASNSKQCRRFQLASKLADVYEQYMLYRPQWIEQWQQNQMPDELNNQKLKETANWQAKIWRLLTEQEAYHQANLQDMAIEQLGEHTDKLPNQIYIFGINALPPKSLAFFEAISAHIPVHLFHLNPSVEFWGDIQTDKAQARKMRTQKVENWLDESLVSNPLLANLGAQGKAFFNCLQQLNTFEISGYSDLENDAEKTADRTILHCIQQDILNLKDGRQSPEHKIDQSVVISSSHSALREIQALHDYLLHQFNQNPQLKPQDILVMCPAIEDYAPYIDAVFKQANIQTEFDPQDKSIILPCSIADRNSLDAEPLINSFTDLLNLPDSRFEVSKILDYIRLPALQQKFGFSETELSTIEYWLEQAQIHWGLDSQHKAQISDLNQASETYTWHWGLQRLIYGFAWGDQMHLANEQLWLPHVEGQQAVLLGRLCHLLERLQAHSLALRKPRTPFEWHAYLNELKQDFFAEDEQELDAFLIIENAINGLTERCQKAGFDKELDLATLRYYLTQHFSQPDASNHFMTGQITFCSMVPMRSIPFKVIAILGLNDGQYPRQQTPISFDLMASTQVKLGDRSRRGDDRYLFLEALISARESLYLSFQGRDIRNNEVRQPSLILKELMEYLTQAYGWQFDIDSDNSQLNVNPLHPFSAKAYQGPWPSFDKNWLRLLRQDSDKNADNKQTESASISDSNCVSGEQQTLNLDIEDLVAYYTNPLASFARQNLKLNFNDLSLVLDDVEPFAVNALDEYLFRQAVCEARIKQQDIADLIEQTKLSGKLPESPIQVQIIEEVVQTADMLAEQVTQYNLEKQIVELNFLVKLSADKSIKLNLTGQLSIDSAKATLVSWRCASRKAKDDIRLWLQHLMAQLTINRAEPTESGLKSIGIFLNGKKDNTSLIEVMPQPQETARQLLESLLLYYCHGREQVQIYYVELAKSLLKKHSRQDINDLIGNPEQVKIWQKYQQDTLAEDEYFNWFFPSGVAYQAETHQALLTLFQPLYQAVNEVKL